MKQQSEEPVLAHDDVLEPMGFPEGDHVPSVGFSEQSAGRSGMVLAAVAAALSAVAVIIMGALLFSDGNSAWPLLLAAAALLAAVVALVAWRRQSPLARTGTDRIIHLP